MDAGLAYLVGVDGGGTHTRARLARLDGTVLGEGRAGPSALGQGVEAGWAQVRAAIDAAIDAAVATAGIEPPAPAQLAAGIGLAGVERPGAAAAFRAAAGGLGALVLDSDGHTALLGAHGGAPGVVLAIGTGAIGCALDADGRRRRAGGWGFPVGDEGSGAWLGLRAVGLAQRALDGRARRGPLAAAVLAITGAEPQALLAWCGAGGQHAYAQLAPLVFECAAGVRPHATDPVDPVDPVDLADLADLADPADPADVPAGADPAAAALLAEAAHAVEALGRALDPEGRLPLAITGGVGRRLLPWLGPALRARCVVPAGDACDGALRLARQALASGGPA